jgi:hypothetical protein
LSGSSHPVVGIWNVEIVNEDDVGILEEPIAAAMERRQNSGVNVTSVNALKGKNRGKMFPHAIREICGGRQKLD